MPILDTPITTDDRNLKKVLGQKQPAILILLDGSRKDTPLEETMQREAKKNADNLLLIRVDAAANPETLAQYGSPALPALVTLTPALFGRKVKSKAEHIRPVDVRSHIDHLLNDTPLPQAKASQDKGANATGTGGKGAAAVTDASFKRDVLGSKVPVLVDFWAVWCAPCRSISPYVEQLAQQYGGKIKVVKLNVDENPVTAGTYDVRSIPTFIVFQDGKAVNRLSGANPQGIRQMVERVANSG